MPELPETETIARDLDAAIRGEVVRTISVTRPDVLRGISARKLTARLTGQCVETVSRRAKSIVLALSGGDRMVVTPRFTGALLLGGATTDNAAAEDAANDAYDCLTFGLISGATLRYNDVRRLGTVALLGTAAYARWDAALGPEPLDPALTAERFSGILRGSRRAVKSILMDQRRLAGVGNIYANEACWHAQVRPARRGRALARQECVALLDALRMILTDSIALRGTTFRDFRDAYGERGGYAAKLAVYGRAGEACRRCSAELKLTHAIEGRATTWCTGCQR
jgi:formamidopyrimidine-DNA glycosylase